VREQLPFEISLLCIRRESQEVEVVRILDDLLCEVGLWWWQRGLEVRERLPLAPVKATLNLHDEDVSAPAVLDSLLDIPGPFNGSFHLIQKHAIVEPR